MLFKLKHIRLILDGLKTETRRSWKRVMVKKYGIYLVQTKMFQRKIDCPLQLQVNCVYKQRLRFMDSESAKREGGYTLEEFKEVWKEINGNWDKDMLVYVINFTANVNYLWMLSRGLSHLDLTKEKHKEIIMKAYKEA